MFIMCILSWFGELLHTSLDGDCAVLRLLSPFVVLARASSIGLPINSIPPSSNDPRLGRSPSLSHPGCHRTVCHESSNGAITFFAENTELCPGELPFGWRHVIPKLLLHERVHALILMPREGKSFSSAPVHRARTKSPRVRGLLAIETHAECLTRSMHVHTISC